MRLAHQILHAVLKQAVVWGKLPRNVADAVRPPRVKQDEMKCWTGQDVRKFLDAAMGHRLYPLFYAAAVTGLRKGELLALRWDDVDLASCKIKVRRGLSDVGGKLVEGEPKTRNSKRTVAFGPDLGDMLEKHKARQEASDAPASGLVFPSTAGTFLNPSNLTTAFRSLQKLAGVPVIRFHDLRHTYATMALRGGIAPKLVSDRLGHATVAFTLDTYAHVLEDMREETALSLTQLFGAAVSGVN